MMTKDINNSQQKLVVLIDADNASPSIIYGLMAEIARYGTGYSFRTCTAASAAVWLYKR